MTPLPKTRVFKRFGFVICALMVSLVISRRSVAQAPEDFKKIDSLKAIAASKKTPAEKSRALTDVGQFYLDLIPDIPDSAFVYFNRVLKISGTRDLAKERLYALQCLGVLYGKRKDWMNSRRSYESVINWYLAKHDLEDAAKTYQWLGKSFLSWQHLDLDMIREAITCSRNAIPFFFALGDKSGVMMSLEDQGNANLFVRNLDSSEYELNSALRIGQGIHSKKLDQIYYLLAAASDLRGDIHKELDYRVKTIESMAPEGDPNDRFLYFYKLACTYEELKQYTESVKFFQLVLSIHPNRVAVIRRAMVDLLASGQKSKGISFFRQHLYTIVLRDEKDSSLYESMMGSYYQALGNNKKAAFFFVKALDYNLQNKSVGGTSTEMKLLNDQLIINFYISIKDFKSAAFYVKQLDATPNFIINELTYSDLEMLKFKVDSGNKNYVDAIKHFERHQKILDSIFNYVKSRQIEGLEVKYATTQKDQDIQLLKKQSTIEEEKSAKRAAVTEYLIMSLLLLAILLAVLLSRYRLRKRSIRLLTEKQTEIIQKNTSLEQLAKDNEWLVKEVHHRVKNNLQVVIGLLQSQTAFLKDDVALNAVLDSQHRIHAMSLIHQKLYKEELETTIYMPEYIGELVEYLKQSFKTGQKIIFTQNIEPIYIDVGMAVPLGLILNEVITNSLKYAFIPGQEGKISIDFTCPDNFMAYLSISDDGCGLPAGVDLENSNSFGLSLIRGLVENDLGGTFEIAAVKGTTLLIAFEINPLS